MGPHILVSRHCNSWSHVGELTQLRSTSNAAYSQLSDYGYSNLATVVAKFTNIEMTAETSSTLARLLYLGSKYKEKIDSEIEAPASSVAAERHMEPANAGDNEDAISEDERDLDQLDIDGTKAHSGMVGGGV
ncbi:hypothetical protein EV182_006793 [Spiromyces aspiralis]|uniref:Uncharacterized protein n=1 Tax=Spiromyces aspiralis TaxID=68401 RepID=A0ACC1HFB8_9FUNG|nr:hypothetical protein EV182_006793 [Spiromyces aspiralis]